MKTSYDCIPCFIRQTLDAVRFVSSDQNLHERVLREVLKAVSSMDLAKSPPLMGQYIHRIIRKYSGSSDPYWKVKKKFNSYALKLYPELKEMIESSPNRFETAVSLAIAGNIIDFGVNAVVNQKVIENNIEQALSEPLLGDIESFHEAVDSAEKILYLGDNTGEIVFDRLLIEQLPKQKVTFAVRGSPVINDATMADAVDTKLNDFVTVIDNGSDAPGTVIEECSEPFRQIFYDADIVIAKGQGNFETLSDTEKTIFFLLKAKCPVVSQHIGCSVGDSVISRINHTKSQ